MTAPLKRNAIANMKHLEETPLTVRLLRSEIRPDPTNRKERSQEKLREIADGMKIRQLQPVWVWEPPGEGGYQIIFGEGRWLAAGINEEELGEAQYLDVVIVENVDNSDVKAMQIMENLQREDPSEIQTARVFRDLLDIGKCKTAKEVAAITGFSEATVSVYLKVIKGPEQVVQLVETGVATMDTARTVLAVHETNPAAAEALVEKGKAEGKLKRDDARAAHAEEKAKANPANKDSPPRATPAASLTKPAEPAAPAAIESMASSTPVAAPAAPAKPQKADPALIAVPALTIHVSIHSDSADADAFHEKAKHHGQPTLADDVVHSDPKRAWVRFGRGTSDEHLMSFDCFDIEVMQIVRKG